MSQFTLFTESQDKSSKLQSQVDLLNVDVEKQKLEHEETMHNAQKDLSSTIINLELRQAELTERLKVSTNNNLNMKRFKSKKVIQMCSTFMIMSNVFCLSKHLLT